MPRTGISERVLRLPCYQPNDRKRIIDETVPTRADFGLPDNAFVFCCFNASHKFTRFNFDRWMMSSSSRTTACSGCSTIRPRRTSACGSKPRRAALRAIV